MRLFALKPHRARGKFTFWKYQSSKVSKGENMKNKCDCDEKEDARRIEELFGCVTIAHLDYDEGDVSLKKTLLKMTKFCHNFLEGG